MKNRDGQMAIDLVKDKKTRDVFERCAIPYEVQFNNNQFLYGNDPMNYYQHQGLHLYSQKRQAEGCEEQYYCIQEQDDEYFYNPNQQIKQNYERNFPQPPTIINELYPNDPNNNNNINNVSNSNPILEDSRVLNQYEIMIQQQNQEQNSNHGGVHQTPNIFDTNLISIHYLNKHINNKDQILNTQEADDVQNNFTFKNFMDHSMENYKEEEIEEQKYDQFVIKDSLYMNSPKFSNHQKSSSTAPISKLKPGQMSLKTIQTPNELGNITNTKELIEGNVLPQQQNADSPTSTRKGKLNEDLIISPNPNNMNEFHSKADKVSAKMYVQKSYEMDFNDIEKYKLQSPQLRGKSMSQTSLLMQQYQQYSKLGSNTGGIDNENEIVEPNMLSPRKHKYYLYFKSLKHRLAQEKSSIGQEMDLSQNTQNVGLVNFNTPTPHKQFQGFSYPIGSEGFTLINEDFNQLKEIESLRKINSMNRLPNQGIDESSSSPKDRILQDYNESVFKSIQVLPQYQVRQKLNFEEEFDESNIVVDDIDTKDIMKIQDSVKLKKIPGINYNENGYKQNKQQIKEYLQINQSIPFKLKNIYNTPCDPKKDLDFKMISNNQQLIEQISNNGAIVTKQEKQIQPKLLNPPIQYNNNQGTNQETILYSNIQPQVLSEIQDNYQNQKSLTTINQQYNNFSSIQSANNILNINNINIGDQNQLTLQTSPLIKRHSINGQLSTKKKIPLSPTPSTNSIFFVNRQIQTIHQLVIDEDMIESAYYQKPDQQGSFLLQNAYEQQSALRKKKQQQAAASQLNSPQIEISYSRKASVLSNKQKYGLEFTQNILEIGISLFNSSPLNGLSFLILFDYIKPESEDIVKFLMQNPSPHLTSQQLIQNFQSNYLLKKSKQAITEILTDLCLQENSEILSYYSTFFNFSNSSFCSALRYFVQELQLENDPEQIDILLSCFAKKFYQQNQQQSTLFESADSVHMLAFATFMLDIDIHFHKEQDLPKLIQEFQMNIQGINDGKNFSQDFVNNIIENLLDKKITHIVSNKLIEKQKQHYVAVFNLLLHEKAQIFVSVYKHNNKTPHQKLQGMSGILGEQELVLFILDNLAIVTNKNHTSNPLSHISIFSMLSLIISYKNQVLILKPAQIFNKNSIQVAKLDPKTQGFIVKQKQQIKFRVKGEEEGKLLDQKLRQLFSSNNNNQTQIKKN